MEKKDSPSAVPLARAFPKKLTRALRRAQMALLWERLRVGAWMPLSLLLVFVATALTGVFDFLPAVLHIALLAGFLAALLACLFHREGLARLRLPDLEERARRLEQENNLAHRPLRSWDDAPALNADNGLWQAHRSWQAEQINKIARIGRPRPRLAARDIYALRVAALLLFIAALGITANPAERLWSAVSPLAAESIPPTRLAIWITPPSYTGRSSVYPDAAPETLQTMEVPENSELVILLDGDDDARLTIREAAGTAAEEAEKAETAEAEQQERDFVPLPAGGLEFRAALETDSEVEVFAADRDAPLRWRFSVVPDRPPEIALTKPVGFTPLGSLRISYSTTDDYGVVSAGARIVRDFAHPQIRRLMRRNGAPPSVPPDSVRLPLTPSLEPGQEKREYHELTSHPWAGLPVRMTLTARDDTGQKGRSRNISFRLPELDFESPLARAFMEMRRNLALNPDSAYWAAHALDALALAPELYEMHFGDYLHLRSVHWKLGGDVTPKALEEARDLLWHMALRAETGKLSDLEERLREVREALKRALAEGAPDREIQELLKKLSVLLTEYLREQARQNSAKGTAPPAGNIETIDADQLSRMLQRISDATALGDYDEAQEMLSKLEDLLENMQFAGGTSEKDRAFNHAVNELRELEQEQQRLLDETFQEQMRSCPPGEVCGDGDFPEERARTLQEMQEALRRRLSDLLEQMEAGGLEAPQALRGGEQSMEEAVEGLGEGDLGESLQAQSEALEQLRRGRGDMMRRGGGTTAGGQGPDGEGGRTGSRNDPLGRSLPDDGSYDEDIVPDDYDSKRARELRDLILQRAGEAWRAREELNYFERLLRKNPTQLLH